MLHVTNGDAAVGPIRAVGVEGGVLPWRDVLHEGPVPGGLPLPRLSEVRADYIASLGWGPADEVRRQFAGRDGALAAAGKEDEVVLWFEHDLYDQLQLIQLLDWFADHPHPRLTLINPPEYLGGITAQRARELFDARQPVTRAQLALGRRAWDAFRGTDPRQLEAVLYAESADALPHLPAALFRLLEEYPATGSGLSRSEEQILIAFSAGPRTLADAYPAAHHDVEDAVWLGDASWMGYVERLAAGAEPLLAWEGDGEGSEPRVSMRRRARITDAGREVLWGRADALWMNGTDRWIGGVHLAGREVPWRWDADEERIAEG
ncbi:MAG TPA: DUF1835 domain-containing protein [Longimicrobium sp.]|jgi:hypothetical protein|uniref:DUF1835 domain-containing protein n=1 Tax=Longimicrobium sp. TaxID=2029185 RepID=UPI002ED9AEB9